ncbi:hypothetical protein PG984_008521 [Apiospora sp. TS-2023a]
MAPQVCFAEDTKGYGPTINIKREAQKGPYTDGIPWNKGEPLPKGVDMPPALDGRIKDWQAQEIPPGAGTLEDPKVLWACEPGKVPGDRIKDREKLLELNGNPEVVQARAIAIGKLAQDLAKDLEFPYAIIT